MLDLTDPDVVNRMVRLTPGAVAVSYGGVDGYGHYAQVPVAFGQDGGVVASEPAVVVADGYFPDLGLDEGSGQARGINAQIVVGDYGWTVRAIEPGEAPGEIRLMLSNRTDG